MNTKRQTVWLVSMLSLMVVLSAYYLFTQDVESPKVVTDGTQTEQPGQNATEAVKDGEGLVVNQVQKDGEPLLITDEDQTVLTQIEEQGIASGGYFSELLAKRDLKNEAEQNRIMSVLAETKSKPEDATPAIAELELLEEKSAKITGLESKLMEQYEIAVIAEESDRFKVVVSSEKLEKKQAADIISLVMSTLDVDASQVMVQYIP